MRHVTEQFIGNAGHRSWVKSRRRVLRLFHLAFLFIPVHLYRCKSRLPASAHTAMSHCLGYDTAIWRTDGRVKTAAGSTDAQRTAQRLTALPCAGGSRRTTCRC